MKVVNMKNAIVHKKEPLLVGVDIGSTTTKIIALEGASSKIVFSNYERHCAAQIQSIDHALSLLNQQFPGAEIRVAFTGSGPLKMPSVSPFLVKNVFM